LRPNATQFALYHAAWIITTRGVASETNAVKEQAPTRSAEHIKFFLLAWGKLITPAWVQVATAHQWATSTARCVAWWDLTMEQRTATLDRCSDTTITIATGR